MKAIISMTEAAAQHVKKIMARTEGAVGFRLAVKETGCSGLMYVPEVIKSAQADDVAVPISSDLVVYVDSHSIHALKGAVIDYQRKGLGQEQLVFNNPNAEGACGCGESFNLKKTSINGQFL